MVGRMSGILLPPSIWMTSSSNRQSRPPLNDLSEVLEAIGQSRGARLQHQRGFDLIEILMPHSGGFARSQPALQPALAGTSSRPTTPSSPRTFPPPPLPSPPHG